MNLAVIGSGAMGSLFSAHLSKVARVVMVGNWQEQILAIRKEGLSMADLEGNKNIYPVSATSDIHNIAPVDAVIILVKSHQTEYAASVAKKILSPKSKLNIALTLQNGLGNYEVMSRVLGADKSLLGTTTQAALLTKPGEVINTGSGMIYIGQKANIAEKAKLLSQLLSKAGFKVQFSDDINRMIWNKLAVNAGINPLTALLNVENGYLISHTLSYHVMLALAREVVEVANKHGVNLSNNHIKENIINICKSTKNNRSSMLQDVLRGAKTEIDAISGEIIALGKKYDEPTPVNSYIYDMVKKLESAEIQPDTNFDFSEIMPFIKS